MAFRIVKDALLFTNPSGPVQEYETAPIADAERLMFPPIQVLVLPETLTLKPLPDIDTVAEAVAASNIIGNCHRISTNHRIVKSGSYQVIAG